MDMSPILFFFDSQMKPSVVFERWDRTEYFNEDRRLFQLNDWAEGIQFDVELAGFEASCSELSLLIVDAIKISWM